MIGIGLTGVGKRTSGRPPVIWPFTIAQVQDASDKRGMALISRPIDRFPLRSEGREDMVGMLLLI
jgi:hypothetical protein